MFHAQLLTAKPEKFVAFSALISDFLAYLALYLCLSKSKRVHSSLCKQVRLIKNKLHFRCLATRF
jgi:hypothetical protein